MGKGLVQLLSLIRNFVNLLVCSKTHCSLFGHLMWPKVLNIQVKKCTANKLYVSFFSIHYLRNSFHSGKYLASYIRNSLRIETHVDLCVPFPLLRQTLLYQILRKFVLFYVSNVQTEINGRVGGRCEFNKRSAGLRARLKHCCRKGCRNPDRHLHYEKQL